MPIVIIIGTAEDAKGDNSLLQSLVD